MNALDVVVAVLGGALIATELWFFLAPKKPPPRSSAPKGGGVQEVRVRIQHGFDPDTVFVEAGRPVRLLFLREETAECSGRLEVPHFGLVQEIPPFVSTAVQFTPNEPGDYVFRCADQGPQGRVVAQIGREAARANLGKGHLKHG